MLNAAIIGCGEMGRIHAECIEKIDGIRNWAFCDLDLSRAESLRDRFHGALATQYVSEIFSQPAIEVVYITTQTNSHLSLTLAALQAGKHVLIEKPLAVSLTEAMQIHQAAEQSNKVVMVGMKFRFYALIQKARRLINNLFMVSVQVMDDPWPEHFWANDPVIGGGNVVSQGVHGSDLLRYLAGGEPSQVFASGANYHQPTGVIDNLAATFSFANGVSGSLIVGDTGQPPALGKFCVQMFGAEGSLLLTERLTWLAFHPKSEAENLEFHGEEDGFMQENRAFVQSIIENAPVPASTWDGYMAQAMIDAAIRSLRSKKAEPVLE